MKRTITILIALALLGVTGLGQDASGFQVIVHSSNPTASITKDQLAKIFLKTYTRWQDGSAVAPVDQAPSSTVRQNFSKAILGRDVATVKVYWQQQTFTGRGTPPTELRNDNYVLEFVKANDGAIGYVTGRGALDGVKVLPVTE